jgi:hypothetical protein
MAQIHFEFLTTTFSQLYMCLKNKLRQRNTSNLADNDFTDSRKADIAVPHVEQHLLFCCSCWIGRPFI